MKVKKYTVKVHEPFNTRIWQNIAADLVANTLTSGNAKLVYSGENEFTLLVENQPNTMVS